MFFCGAHFFAAFRKNHQFFDPLDLLRRHSTAHSVHNTIGFGIDSFLHESVLKYRNEGNRPHYEKKGKKMAEYQKMYYILCDGASRALDALPDTPETQAARLMLQEALYAAEELYISAPED